MTVMVLMMVDKSEGRTYLMLSAMEPSISLYSMVIYFCCDHRPFPSQPTNIQYVLLDYANGGPIALEVILFDICVMMNKHHHHHQNSPTACIITMAIITPSSPRVHTESVHDDFS